MTKKIIKSKLVWFNLLYTVAEIILLVKDIIPAEYAPIAIAIQGSVNIILRIWFTNTTLTANGR